MAGAHGVDIGLTHQGDILEHSFHVNGAAAGGVRILGVHAAEEDALAVDFHQSTVDFHVAETVFRGKGHGLLASGILLADFHGVEVGRLVVPGQESAQVFKGEGGLYAGLAARIGDEFLLRGYLLARGADEGGFDGHLAVCETAVVNGQGHIHRAALVVVGRIERGGDIVVADGDGGRGVEINVAVQARHVPHILAFEIGAVAPANHLHGDGILASVNVCGQVELGIVVAALRIAHVLAVEPNEGCAVKAIEVKEHALARCPVVGQGESAAVRAHGVLVDTVHLTANEGRVAHEGVLHIDVDGFVVALHFPAGGHFDVVPSQHVGGSAPEVIFSGTLEGVGGIVEFPGAVEREVLCLLGCQPRIGIARVGAHRFCGGVGDEGGVAVFLVFLVEGFVLPYVAGVGGQEFEAEIGVLVRAICCCDELVRAVLAQVIGIALVSACDLIDILLAFNGCEGEVLVVVGLVHRIDQGCAGVVEAEVDVVARCFVLQHHGRVSLAYEPHLRSVLRIGLFGIDEGFLGRFAAQGEGCAVAVDYLIAQALNGSGIFAVFHDFKAKLCGLARATADHNGRAVGVDAQHLRLVVCIADLVNVCVHGLEGHLLVGVRGVDIPLHRMAHGGGHVESLGRFHIDQNKHIGAARADEGPLLRLLARGDRFVQEGGIVGQVTTIAQCLAC